MVSECLQGPRYPSIYMYSQKGHVYLKIYIYIYVYYKKELLESANHIKMGSECLQGLGYPGMYAY